MSFDFSVWKDILPIIGKDKLINIIAQLVEFIDQLSKERDEWKANHDNQVKIKRTLTDRPDLQERAHLVQELNKKVDDMQIAIDAVWAAWTQGADFQAAVELVRPLVTKKN